MKLLKDKFDDFLLEVFLRIARYWGCDVEVKGKEEVEWIKIIF